jgi:hypothetical protein
MFTKRVDSAVDCFRPLLKKLKIREDPTGKRPIALIEVPELDFLGLPWTLTIIKEKNNDSSLGKLVTRYRAHHDNIQSIIFLDNTLYYDSPISHVKRRIVAVHEFCHFIACIYAYTADKDKFLEIIKNRRDANVGDIWNPDVQILYKLLTESRNDTEKTLNGFEHTQHTHFYMGVENILISYTELFLNLLFSRGAFEEFFDLEKQKQFFNLWRSEKRSDALQLYDTTIGEAAAEKWVPLEFARSQAMEWLKSYIRNPIMT